METEQDLKNKIRILNEKIWENRIKDPEIEDWLDNFESEDPDERLEALYLLSNFMYFGSDQMRELLKSVFRDLYKYPIIENIRMNNNDTTDTQLINQRFEEVLFETRFLGIGNPSESGCHLLYYFRQENELPKDLFIHTHKIFSRDRQRNASTLRYPNVKRYVFIDDFCGSGTQGVDYSKDILEELKDIKQDAFASYFVLFATTEGIEKVRNETLFNDVQCIFNLDDSFKCFSENSRIFLAHPEYINKENIRNMCLKYGQVLCPDYPLGYGDCQLLIGFNHNIPDNTLPIIWGDEQYNNKKWAPIFKRYHKLYSEFI